MLSIKRIIDVSTVIQPTPSTRRNFAATCFVFKGAEVNGARVNSYTSYADIVAAYGSNSEPAKAALKFFSGGFNGLKPSVLWVANFNSGTETWSNIIVELLSDPRYFYIALDNTFTTQENQDLIDAIEAATKISYVGSILTTDPVAANTSLNGDTTSIAKSMYEDETSSTFLTYDLVSASAEYKQLVALSYFATVGFNKARPLGSLAFKTFSGLTPIFNTVADTTQDTYAGNLSDKNCNYYASYGESGRSVYYKGVMPNGTQVDVVVGAKWLDYNVTYNIYDLLVTLPKLAFTNEDFSKLYSVITKACDQAVAFGLIAPATVDGVDYPTGYEIFIPEPKDISSTDKALGLLNGVTVTAVIAGTVVKIELTNILKY